MATGHEGNMRNMTPGINTKGHQEGMEVTGGNIGNIGNSPMTWRYPEEEVRAAANQNRHGRRHTLGVTVKVRRGPPRKDQVAVVATAD